MTRFALILLAMMFAALPPLSEKASAQPVDGGKAMVELISELNVVEPGSSVTLGLKLDMDPGWHVYWRNAGDAGLPPQIIWDETSGVEAGEFLWPIPEELPVVPNQIMDYGYSNTLVLPFEVTIPATASGTLSLTGMADYLICEDICIPEQAPVKLDISIGPEASSINAGLITLWESKTPSDFVGEVVLDRGEEGWTLSLRPDLKDTLDGKDLRFFPYDHHIVHSAAQPAEFGNAGACIALTEATDGFDTTTPPSGIIVAEDEGGTRLGYRMTAETGALLPDTCAERPAMPVGSEGGGIGSSDYTEGGAGAGSSGAAKPFNLFTVSLLALLGGLILNLMPCVLPVLSIKALGMVQSTASGHKAEVRAHGIWYTVGVLLSFGVLAAAFLAVRAATGAANIGFQLQSPVTVIILILIIFLIGLWLLGIFELGSSVQNVGSGLAGKQGSMGAFFTGVLAAVVGAPCVGPFIGGALGAVIDKPAPIVVTAFLAMGLGLALPFLLISFVPNLQRLLPKPGAWMETLKQFFAFPMFLTAAWLLAVLGALTNFGVVGWTVAGMTAIAFGLWALRSLPGKGGLRLVVQGLAALALIGGVAGPINAAITPPPVVADWSPELITELVEDDKAIFVDFTAVWCVTCQANKRSTLNTDRVKKAFADNNVAFLTADFTKKDPVIAAELARHNRPGVPMYLYYPAGSDTPMVLDEVLTPGYVIGIVGGK